MNDTKIASMIEQAWRAAEPVLREHVLREVDARIEQFRRSVYIREDWCCNDMRRFALDTWGATKPRTETDAHFGNVSYQLRGHHVNYCPFCGVSFTPTKAKG